MQDKTASAIIGKRYQIKSELGTGGMGVVYRAHDRLTGQPVALKRVNAPSRPVESGKDKATLQFPKVTDSSSKASTEMPSTKDRMDTRLALAQEFQLLASLRHPNIISVLDYGFDDGNPYFTMELLDNAQTIMECGRGQPLSVQVGLLVQVLQALAYLHRRGVIHHDMKPGNVLVIGDQVKVLDFGLSVVHERGRVAFSAVGTLAYMAPEVLKGYAAVEATDLYAVGVMAYELFTGRPLFEADDISALINHIITVSPDLMGAGIDLRLVPVLMQLLAKSPADRYTDAVQVIMALDKAIDQPFLPENAATRESFLQAARLVGRDAELSELTAVLVHTIKGRGRAMLVGGESGVGKSRLLDELRVIALSKGAVVLRGQGIRDVGSLYHVWRPIFRWLSLLAELTTEEASILKPLVPDIATLLEKEVPDASALDPEAAQARLLLVIETLFRRQKQPALIILEDIQWAGSENLAILTRLNRIVHDLPVFIIASYTTDERADLPSLLPEMQAFKLNRLKPTEIAELSYAMLGGLGREEQIVDLLQRETEGNVFFLVEIVRALAESAGRLDLIGKTTLPTRILTGKVQDIVRHRIERVPVDARPPLHVAAVLGRQLNLLLLRKLEPQTDLDRWLTTCADLAILDVQDGNWRFAHDKLREVLLAELSEADRRALHARSAQAIEAVSPNPSEQAVTLAFHWRMAGDAGKERDYCILAGEQALRNGAYREAIEFHSRALELRGQNMPRGQQAYLMRQLADAHYGLGNLTESRDYLYQVLNLLNYRLPATRAGSILGIMVEMLNHGLHQIVHPNRGRNANPALNEATRACERLAQIYYLEHDRVGGLLTVLRLLNLGEAIGPSPELARAYISGTLACGILGLHPLAEEYSRRAQKIARQAGQILDVAYVSEVNGIYCAGMAQWAKAEALCKQSVETFERSGNMRWWEESSLVLGIVAFRKGEFTVSSGRFKQVYVSAHRRGGIESQIWGLSGNLWSLLPLGIIDETFALLEALPLNHVSPADRICVYTALAEAYLQKQNKAQARKLAGQAAQLAAHFPPGSQFSFPGYSGIARIYLELWEASRDEPPEEREALRKLARQAYQRVWTFARAFAAGRPYALLWQGLYHWLDGKQDRALKLWQQCIDIAEQQAQPYERGLAHYEIGRHLPPNDPARERHLSQARDIFVQLGATYNLERVRAASTSAVGDRRV